MRHSALAVLLTCLAAAPAAADVTIKSKTTTVGPTTHASESTVWIKGSRMRMDEVVRGAVTTVMIDANADEMTAVNHLKGEVDIFSLKQATADLQKIPAADVKAELKATDRKREFAGLTCVEHTARIVVTYDPALKVPDGAAGSAPKAVSERMSIVLTGPVCLSADAPGRQEYSAFYALAARKGLSLSDPRTTQAQPAQAKSTLTLLKTMAEAGIPLKTELETKFEGGGPLASMMGRLGAMARTSEAISVSTKPIPAETFSVPKTYKVTRR